MKQHIPATQTHFEARSLQPNSYYEFWVTSSTTVGEGQSTRVVKQLLGGPEGMFYIMSYYLISHRLVCNILSLFLSTVPAKIMSFGSRLTVPWNGHVELPCKVVGVPLPVTEWIFE